MTAVTGCSFCGRPRSAVRYVVTAPAAAICDGCIALAARLGRGEPAGAPPCSFCREHTARCQHAEGGARICDVCIDLCVGILREEGGIDVTITSPDLPPATARSRNSRTPRS